MNSSRRKCGTFGSNKTDVQDYHHLLWSRHDWSEGTAHLLRDDPYFGIFVPQETFHRPLHSKIMRNGIPVPENPDLLHDACERIYYAKKHNIVNIRTDPPRRRLEFLIHLWQNAAPATVTALEAEIIAFERYEVKYLSPQPTLALIPGFALA